MKRLLFVLLGTLLLALPVAAAKWEVDKAHSSVNFKVSHMVISTVNGKFETFDGSFDFDPKNLATGTAEMTIDVASINTDNDKRDGHLKSADFFDAEKYPKITFKSKKVIPGTGKNFKIVGDLTIRDVTKEVTFDCVFNGSAEFMGTTKAGFTCSTTINRQDYHVNWSKTLDNGGLVAGNDVDITLDLELNQVK
jgi:polyisoprenoid-binding protein YceI